MAPAAWRRIRPSAAPLAALLALSTLFYPDLMFQGLILADFDVLTYFYPLRSYAAQAIASGRLPLWNSSTFLGAPFLANPQAAVFYPFSVLFYVLPTPFAYTLTLALHFFLAGAFFFLFARVSLRVGAWAAFMGAMAFTFSGFLVGQTGHLNQLSAAAWLPLLLVCGDQALVRRSLRLMVLAALVLAVQFLAGHPQESYMSGILLAIFLMARSIRLGPRSVPHAIVLLLGVGLLGAGLAAVQLGPTYELSRLSIRGQGVDYADAVFNALPTWLLPWALLPGFWRQAPSTEFLGYIGTVSLVAALLAVVAARSWWVAPALLASALGVTLALGEAVSFYQSFYEVVPGFGLFRVPARWLFISTCGAAALAALGVQAVLSGRLRCSVASLRRPAFGARLGLLILILYLGLVVAPQEAEPVPRRLIATWLALGGATAGLLLAAALVGPGKRWSSLLPAALAMLSAGELWMAASELGFRYPVPSSVFALERESTRYLQTQPPGRILSVAHDNYEIRETPVWKQELSWLEPRALQYFLIGAKHQEVLAPNTSLLYGLDSADGYDGGVLPLGRFLDFSALLVAPAEVRPDGVLRSRLEYVPPVYLLDLMKVRYVVAGKIRDANVDGVPYDRAVTRVLAPRETLSLSIPPSGMTSSLGLISAVTAGEAEAGELIGAVRLVGASGEVRTVPVGLGRQTGTERERGESVQASQALGRWFVDGKWDHYFRTAVDPPIEVVRVEVENLHSSAELSLRSITLIDDAAQTPYPLVLDDRLQRAEFFDVKVYTVRDAPPIANLVHQAQIADDPTTLEWLRDGRFDARIEVLLSPHEAARALSGPGLPPTRVEVHRPQPERLAARFTSPAAGYLVLSESLTRGWRATVDGREAPLLRANYLFQAAPVGPGDHVVEFIYDPVSFKLGLALTVASVLAAAALLVWGPAVQRLLL